MLSRPDYLGLPGADLQSTPLSADARKSHARIVALLKEMLRAKVVSPVETGFVGQHRLLLDLITHFQQQVLECEKRTPSCARGCAACCMHWVEDVNSFEAIALADYLRQRHPDRIASIVARCREDALAMEALDQHVQSAMTRSASQRAEQNAEFDQVDLLLASFYRLRRPCPLLDSDNTCMVYEQRPITCRIYVSFSPPTHCDPEYADEHDVPTVLLDLEESANALLDQLHERFDTLDNDTSLRTQLLRLLGSDT
jgi:Fe-S-cluster containining protein